MNLENASQGLAGYSMGRLKNNRMCVVLTAKATYDIPIVSGEEPVLSAEQVPLHEADAHMGEPGFSPTLYENDFAPYKPRCDVILHGSAYAPHNKESAFVDVRLQVSTLDKAFRVVGDRQWQKMGLFENVPSPLPFISKKIHYGCAFGGSGFRDQDQQKPFSFVDNPVGVGYFEHRQKDNVINQPLPNTEEINQPVKDHQRQYRPMSFGPIARNFACRYPLAGTYDQHWIDHVSPFWPDDFDNLYHQCAPKDQQVDHLQGGEVVRLENLSPEGVLEFQIPTVDMPMMVLNSDNQQEVLTTALDTLIIEPDERRFSLVWRAHRPLKVNIHEIDKVVVGKISPAWWRAIQTGKTWNPHIKKKPFEDAE